MKLTEKNRDNDNVEVVDVEKYNKTKTQKLFRDNKTVNQSIMEKIMKYEEDFAKI